jgi:hypothetical protein
MDIVLHSLPPRPNLHLGETDDNKFKISKVKKEPEKSKWSFLFNSQRKVNTKLW